MQTLLVSGAKSCNSRPKNPGESQASAGSIGCGIRVQKTQELLPAHWRVKPDHGVSAGLTLAQPGPIVSRAPGAGVRSLGGGGTVPDTFGYAVLGVLKLVLAC